MFNTTSFSSAITELPGEAPDPLHVIIAHDDHRAYVRALRMLANTFYGHPEASHLRPLPWRFDELLCDPWRKRAVADAPRADVFVVSKSSQGALPSGVSAWLEECFALRKNASTAVIALCDVSDEQRDAPCRDLLRQLATRAGVDFLEAVSPAAVAG
jgi:hypothetical protein